MAAFARCAEASEWFGDFYQIGPLIVGESSGACFGMNALSDGDFVTSLRYTRAAPGSILNPPGDARVFQTELVSFQIPPSGVPVSRCFVPSDGRGSSHSLEIIVNAQVEACRGYSRLEFDSAGFSSTMFEIDVGSSAEPGATAVLFAIGPTPLPPGWSVSFPASIPMPPPGQRTLVPITVHHPALAAMPPQTITIHASLNTRDHFFHEFEVEIATAPSVPALSPLGLAMMGIVMGVAGVRSARRLELR